MHTKLKQEEFDSIKSYLEAKKPKNPAMFFIRTANQMERSLATITRIDSSKDYESYKKLIASEHLAKHPRVPLQEQLIDARISELLLIRSKGRLGAYRKACERLTELGF